MAIAGGGRNSVRVAPRRDDAVAVAGDEQHVAVLLDVPAGRPLEVMEVLEVGRSRRPEHDVPEPVRHRGTGKLGAHDDERPRAVDVSTDGGPDRGDDRLLHPDANGRAPVALHRSGVSMSTISTRRPPSNDSRVMG